MKDEIPDDTITEACFFKKLNLIVTRLLMARLEERCKKQLLRIKLIKKMLYMIIKVRVLLKIVFILVNIL